MSVELQTVRLLLRPLQLADAEQAQPLFAEWEIVKYLNAEGPWPYPKNRVYHYHRVEALTAIERREDWHWSLRLKESPEILMGSIGLFQSLTDNRGYWLGLP